MLSQQLLQRIFAPFVFMVANAVLPAEASEWGCEVLLCSSSSNPSWHAIPACHPPMYRLIDAINDVGFSWPVCEEGGTGRPGYEKYGACPPGWLVGYSDAGHGAKREPDLCVKSANRCRGLLEGSENCSSQAVSIPRPIRSDPYYFDLPASEGTTSRHWFNLKK
jgi:hypothetical protein